MIITRMTQKIKNKMTCTSFVIIVLERTLDYYLNIRSQSKWKPDVIVF